MEFLKAFFGDKAITYDELVQAINAYNCDEKNKEKLIKMVNHCFCNVDCVILNVRLLQCTDFTSPHSTKRCEKNRHLSHK